jgi:ankyrin repeat protein
MNAVKGTDVRLFHVSRDEPEIREALEENVFFSEYRIGAGDVEADTAAFSQSIVDKKLSNKSEDLRLAISEAMTVRCEGQFLWIKMQEQSLRNGMSKKRLHEVVESMPSGLDRLYDHNWNRIMNMCDWDRDRAIALLRWTAFTFLPLNVYAVTEAVLITQFEELDPDEHPENVDDEYVRTEILGLCGPLVEVHDYPEDSSPGNRTLHIPHFSVRQYLVKHLPAPAWMQANDILHREHEMVHHTAIARACVQYLSLPQVWERDGHPDLCARAFLFYAAHYWMRHARSGFMDPTLLDLSKAFLLSDNNLFKSLVNYLLEAAGTRSGKVSVFQPQLRPFEYVIYKGWIKMANHLIEDADVNEIGAFGRSPIFSACKFGSAESVNMLIRHGADLSVTDYWGMTCLHVAAARGFEDIVRILVESKVHLSPQDHRGITPLHLASRGGHVKCCQYLIRQGADMNIKNNWGGSVVHDACCQAGRAGLLRFILQNGPDTLATDHHREIGSPLLDLSLTGDVDMAKVLFEHGAVSSLVVPNYSGELPLHLAASEGHTELVKLFLERGAEKTLSIPTTDGSAALHFACCVAGRDNIISLLLRPGVEESLLMKDENGDTPLHVASGAGYASYVKSIIQYSEPEHQRLLEIRNSNLETPLFIASNDGCTEVVKTLLEHGAEPTLHVLNFYNWSPLWAASFNGHSEIVKELLFYGAGKTITTPNVGGETPLHIAAAHNHIEVLKLLLEVPDVSINQKTTYGFTALFIASRNGYRDIVELLLAVDSIDKDSDNWLGLSPLFSAVANGHLEVAKLLLSRGTLVKPWVSIGWDLLWWAERSNVTDLVQLLKAREDLSCTSSGSHHPLPGPFTNLEPLTQYAATVACKPGMFWCYVCTLSVRDDQEFRCIECDYSCMCLCSDCFSRGFQLCPRSHVLIPLKSDQSDSSSSSDGSVDSQNS